MELFERFSEELKSTHGGVSSPINKIIIREGAIQEVPKLISYLTEEKLIYLVGDQNTFRVAGDELAKLLSQNQYDISSIVLEEDPVVADPDTLFKIIKDIGQKGYLIACGSGTINDLVKYIGYKLGRRYSVVATAPSMDGYASSCAALTVNGVKETYQADPPEVIVADLNILKAAPWEMIQSGFGDLLGKNTSLLDWKLANILFEESYCPEIAGMVQEALDRIIKIGNELKERSPESIRILMEGLIYSGIAMLVVGNSRPASGSEHHFSHFLEMYGLLYNKEVPTHGIMVGLGTYFTSSFYLRLLELDYSHVEMKDSKDKRIKRIRENYKARSEIILRNLEERWERQILVKTRLIEREAEIKGLIADRRMFLEKTLDFLSEVGILEREDLKALDDSWIEKALKNSFEIRGRYTISTLLYQLGYLDKWSDELLMELKQRL